jgi:hypothetical protein
VILLLKPVQAFCPEQPEPQEKGLTSNMVLEALVVIDPMVVKLPEPPIDAASLEE